MLPAGNRGAGANICAPDVCITAARVPVPFVNMGPHATAVGFSTTTFVCMLPALHIGSTIPKTTGDEAGVLGPGPSRIGVFLVGNPTVAIDMIPAVNLTCPAMGNAGNARGAALIPSVVNVFYNHAAPPLAPGALDAADLQALHRALADAPAPEGRMLGEGVGYLRLAVFSAPVSTLVYNVVQRLAEQGMRALVLDLRGNPGGDLAACLRLAADFLPEGAPIARVVDADGDEQLHRSRRDGPHRMPLALLVDGRTASAAELFAGCLQTHGRALLVGAGTFGKGSAQRLINADDGASVVYRSVAECRLPGGERIDGAGLRPEVAVCEPGAPAIDAAVAALLALRG